MTSITKIEIKKIKGIDEKSFNFRIIPNKPNLFVAPNGFGKSSIAIAFNSLKRNKIDLEDENIHNGSSEGDPSISITLDDGRILEATNQANEISDEFSVFVINSQIYSEASTRSFAGRSITKSNIGVRPITLINTIPAKKMFAYSYTNMKTQFGECRKLLINFSSIINDTKVIDDVGKIKNCLDKMELVQRNRKLERFMEYIKSVSGSKEQLKSRINDFTLLEEIEEIDNIIKLLEKIVPEIESDVEKYINAIQLIFLYRNNKADFNSIIKYNEYLRAKNLFQQMLSSFDVTWKNIKPEKKGNSLILQLPTANSISNGERDVICFIGKLFEAQSKLVKDKGILIIDEIFDYMDDGNLIAVQYFINSFISEFKSRDKEIYPIILTHLDPQHFKTYCFKVKHTHYLDSEMNIVNKYKINNLLKDRGDNDNIAKYFLHFHTHTTNEKNFLKDRNVDPLVFEATDFRRVAINELGVFKENVNYDIAFVCCGLRIIVEENIYNKLFMAN